MHGQAVYPSDKKLCNRRDSSTVASFLSLLFLSNHLFDLSELAWEEAIGFALGMQQLNIFG